MIHEVAKTWAEADGDTAEAIDFCEFYGREMLRYAGEHPLVNVPGEQNDDGLCAAGCRRRDSAVELSARDHGGHDARFGCHRQHGCAEAFFRRADDRVQVFRDTRRSRSAAGRC